MGNFYISILIYVPPRVQHDTNTTLLFNLEKTTIREVSDNDKMTIWTYHMLDIDADKTHVITNITGPFDDYYVIRLNRKVSDEDIRNIKQDKMPGFRSLWKYDNEVELWTKYKTDNNQFTRLAFFNCFLKS